MRSLVSSVVLSHSLAPRYTRCVILAGGLASDFTMGRLVVCIFPRVFELLIPIATTAKPHASGSHRDTAAPAGVSFLAVTCGERHITPHPKLHGRLCQMPNTAHHHKDFTSSHYRFAIQKSRSEPWYSASPSLRCCDSAPAYALPLSSSLSSSLCHP